MRPMHHMHMPLLKCEHICTLYCVMCLVSLYASRVTIYQLLLLKRASVLQRTAQRPSLPSQRLQTCRTAAQCS